ncbi:hypothetical protein AJ80_06435 [Polytolypa hystricis UAMH7299]|uniref:VOC domain-containing protein n=1 Tax=Polytolypa hystricis (strain UAMH7299) TaxID=1447883 RepID=A0A2B7XW61_POLH7|nr:hypothetical protein AJ80_06435 [Polytolypa hystricis UAMH7299]
MATKEFNRVVNHVAVSVPDCDAAVKWYTENLGFRLLQASSASPESRTRKDAPDAPIFKIYGDDLHEVKTAFLTTGNGVGFEIFEFLNPKYNGPSSTTSSSVPFSLTNLYTRGGFFHIAITDPDPERLCARVVAAGGKQIGVTTPLHEGQTALYFRDPWGNVVEVVSCSFEQLLANR